MPPFGENLRREREMRGVTLEEISLATKISSRFLQAIESEEFSKLPGGIFARSFIRAYARYLGLDEERVLAEYQLAAQPPADLDLHRLIVSKPPPARSGARTPLLALLIAAAMLSSGYALFRYSRRAALVPRTQPGAARESTAPAQAAPPFQESNPPASTTAAASPDAGTSSSALPAALRAGKGGETDTGLILQVAATEHAWVAVDADGRTSLQRVMNPNEVETLKARNSFDVTTGNAQGIILTLNGETLKPLGRRGEVKSVHLTHDDLKNPAP